MKFLQRLNKLYTVISSELSSQLMQLAKDIIDLDYDVNIENDLLSSLEKIYDSVKGKGTVADINWEQSIKDNKEKKERLKEKMAEKNERAKQHYQKPTQAPFEKKAKEKMLKKKEVAKKIKEMTNNVVSVDFTPKPKVPDINIPTASKERVERIKFSLQKINHLMSELKNLSAQEQKDKLKLV